LFAELLLYINKYYIKVNIDVCEKIPIQKKLNHSGDRSFGGSLFLIEYLGLKIVKQNIGKPIEK